MFFKHLTLLAGMALSVSTVDCTALGPMPAATGVSPVPATRPDVALQAGVVPGYYLSSSVNKTQTGTGMGQIAATIEPDRWISVPGLIAGLRYAGDEQAHPSPEPMLGYRTFIEDTRQLAIGGVAYGTYASGESRGADYSAVRAGLEASADLRLTPISKWFELHLLLATSLTGLSADGTYCLDSAGQYGIDCAEPPNAPSPTTNGHAAGFYPSATGGLGLDFAQHLDTWFHGGRLTVAAAAGTMPRVVAGEQESAKTYAAGEVLLTLGFGASEQTPPPAHD